MLYDLSPILQGIIKRTREGKLNWRISELKGSWLEPEDAESALEKPAAFSASIDDNTNIYISWMGVKLLYRFEILDAEDSVVVALQTLGDVPIGALPTPEQALELSLLFALARHSAHQVDSMLEKLAQDLDVDVNSDINIAAWGINFDDDQDIDFDDDWVNEFLDSN